MKSKLAWRFCFSPLLIGVSPPSYEETVTRFVFLEFQSPSYRGKPSFPRAAKSLHRRRFSGHFAGPRGNAPFRGPSQASPGDRYRQYVHSFAARSGPTTKTLLLASSCQTTHSPPFSTQTT